MKRQCKQKHLSDKGFSLVELIITMLISSIVTAAVAGFLTMGLRMYQNTDAETVLQTESQIAELFLTELLQESDNYEVIDSTSFSEVSYAVKVIRGAKVSVVIINGNQLWYGDDITSTSDQERIQDVLDLGKSGAFLASNIQSLALDPITHSEAISSENGLVKIDYTFQVGSRQYIESAFVSLRNKARN